MDNNKIASELVKLAQTLIAKDKPRHGDYVALRGDNFVLVDKVLGPNGSGWKIEDNQGEEFNIVRDEHFDTEKVSGWKAL